MAFSKFILLLQINNAFLFQDNRFNSISLERKIKIGVSIANFDDTFLTYMMDGMKKYAATDSNIELEFVDAKEDISKQMNQVENFVTQGKEVITSFRLQQQELEPWRQQLEPLRLLRQQQQRQQLQQRR